MGLGLRFVPKSPLLSVPIDKHTLCGAREQISTYIQRTISRYQTIISYQDGVNASIYLIYRLNLQFQIDSPFQFRRGGCCARSDLRKSHHPPRVDGKCQTTTSSTCDATRRNWL